MVSVIPLARFASSTSASATRPPIYVYVAKSYFVSVMKRVQRPGLIVDKLPEQQTTQGNQRLLQIGYILRSEMQEPGHPDRLLLVTLNREPDAEFAIVATAAVVKSR